MRILIFGVSGMLGHKLYQRLILGHEVVGTIRGRFDSIERFEMFDRTSVIEDVRAEDVVSVERAIAQTEPHCVINGVGLIKQLLGTGEVVKALTVNSIFPHRLKDMAERRGARVIMISTDCVFDGTAGNYVEADQPTARDLYGLSKMLGELSTSGCLTLRTSMIGRELSSSNSIVEWFLTNRGGSVAGFRQAMYSGLTTLELADVIAMLVEQHRDLDGLFHLSGEPISKYELLVLLNEAFAAGVSIEPDERVAVDRTLDSSAFRDRIGYRPPSWPEMVERLASDPTPYDRFRP